MIVGIDEVGRGPWAGPLVMGAVILGGIQIDGLTDSKKLTKKKRDQLDKEIRQHAKAVGLGWVHADELDEIGLSAALTLACRRAVEQIDVPYHEIIIDGTVNFLKDTGKGPYVTTMKKADLLVPSVSAASVVAKVARDNWMAEQDAVYEHYNFASHVGYGTAAHSAAIERHGLTPLHRRSFAPIARYAATEPPLQTGVVTKKSVRTTKLIGDAAETVAADWLSIDGFRIIERNWKTKRCEIDIVAERNNTIYFIEVKYRRSTDQGGGLAAITPTKLKQIKFAAKYYATVHKLHDTDLRLAVISLSGEPPIFETYLEVE